MQHDFLAGLTSGFTPVIDAGFSLEEYQSIDLSVNNEELAEHQLNSAEAFQVYLDDFLRKRNKKVAVGGYNEHRNLYRRSDLFSAAVTEDLLRNIHLGVDIWVPAGTAVLAVLDGKIHSFRNNINFGDYGPTIVLEHQTKNGIFHTLYGHLSRKSLEGLTEGGIVRQGQKIAELGDANENGDYAPHLHFQVITAIGKYKGDFPGVASKREIKNYLKNCPDPNLLLKINSLE